MSNDACSTQSHQRVFISYCSSDRRRVDGLERLISLFGHEVFLDVKTIRLGARWRDEIRTALDDSDVTFVYWTRSASLSPWVRNEYEYVLTHYPDRPLVPVIGDATPLAEPLKDRQGLNFLPILNELVDLKQEMQAEGRSRAEIRIGIQKKLEEAGVDLDDSDLNKICRFMGVAGWLTWLPAPLLLLHWIWRSLFDGALQLTAAQTAIVIVGAAASGAVVWRASGVRLEREHEKRIAVETRDSNTRDRAAMVGIRGVREPTVIQLTDQERGSHYTVYLPTQQDLRLLVPPGAYAAHFARPKVELVHEASWLDENGTLLQGERFAEKDLRSGERYTLTVPLVPLRAPSEPPSGAAEPVGVVTSDSIVETVAGNSPGGDDKWGDFGGDDGPADQALLNNPSALAIAQDGSVYIADTDNHRVRRVSAAGVITTVAGSGIRGFSGDGEPAVKANLSSPRGLALGPKGNLFIYDWGNRRVRRVDSEGIISTVAGGGSGGLGDGGPATEARLDDLVGRAPGGFYRGNAVSFPAGLDVAPDGSLFVVDANALIRRVDPDGTISTYAGSVEGESGESATANVSFQYINGIALAPTGDLYVADIQRVHKIHPDGTVATLPLDLPTIRQIADLAIGPSGSLYFCEAAVGTEDNDHHAIRRRLEGGEVLTIAGDGPRGLAGDGGPAGKARIQGPTALAVAPDGTLYFCDSGNHRVRRILPVRDAP